MHALCIGGVQKSLGLYYARLSKCQRLNQWTNNHQCSLKHVVKIETMSATDYRLQQSAKTLTHVCCDDGRSKAGISRGLSHVTLDWRWFCPKAGDNARSALLQSYLIKIWHLKTSQIRSNHLTAQEALVPKFWHNISKIIVYRAMTIHKGIKCNVNFAG